MKKVTSIKQLRYLATLRKSVIWTRFGNTRWPAPAAWVLNMNAGQVASIMEQGMEVYEPKHERRER